MIKEKLNNCSAHWHLKNNLPLIVRWIEQVWTVDCYTQFGWNWAVSLRIITSSYILKGLPTRKWKLVSQIGVNRSSCERFTKVSAGSRISPRRGHKLPRGERQHTILPYFPENCMKLKEFGPQGGLASLAPPLRSATLGGSCSHPLMPMSYKFWGKKPTATIKVTLTSHQWIVWDTLQ